VVVVYPQAPEEGKRDETVMFAWRKMMKARRENDRRLLFQMVRAGPAMTLLDSRFADLGTEIAEQAGA